MLFRKKIAKRCEYCCFSTRLDEDTVLCSRKGQRPWDGKCLRFRYDPTKRVPLKAKAMDFGKYDGEDFSL